MELNNEKLKELARLKKNEYSRNWRKANRERANEYQREWRRANPDKVREYQENFWKRQVLKDLEAYQENKKG